MDYIFFKKLNRSGGFSKKQIDLQSIFSGILTLLILLLVIPNESMAQNFDFNFNASGKRVCLAATEFDPAENRINILLLDSLTNSGKPTDIYRRPLGSIDWTKIASEIPAGTGHWTDNQVNMNECMEYQIRRKNTWTFEAKTYDAIGYTIGCTNFDNTLHKGRVILLVAEDIPTLLPEKYAILKKELAADGWIVDELVVPRAEQWDSGDAVVGIRESIQNIYQNAPIHDKPVVLFILGHVPLPRCGSTDVTAPDAHEVNQGARGCDAYYADIDGIYTDTARYDPEFLITTLADNYPGDYKWDQDFFPSDIEMAFGRVDFADLNDPSIPEIELTGNYLDRLSRYKNVAEGYDMGEKSAFFFGYDNSNDGSYRSLLNISGPQNVYQNHAGFNHSQWVLENGPFKIYMQNRSIPDINAWKESGMDATVFSSDQSYWGFGDVPQGNNYSRIRSILALDTKCLITLWTTTGINIFHQACTGLSLGLAMKQIMNHNEQNQYLEKAPQQYDTQDWWNRTHFAFYGDPTLNLYQIAPPQNVTLAEQNSVALLSWTPSKTAGVAGYHVYSGESEAGHFERITSELVTEGQYTIQDYRPGHWYMVKAVKPFTSGCGSFLHASLGISVEATFTLDISVVKSGNPINIFPNPTNGLFRIKASKPVFCIEILGGSGQLVHRIRGENMDFVLIDLTHIRAGNYILKVLLEDGTTEGLKFVKTDF